MKNKFASELGKLSAQKRKEKMSPENYKKYMQDMQKKMIEKRYPQRTLATKKKVV